jgi:hypothetical protein
MDLATKTQRRKKNQFWRPIGMIVLKQGDRINISCVKFLERIAESILHVAGHY